MVYCPITVKLWTNSYSHSLLSVPNDVYGTVYTDYGFNYGFSLVRQVRVQNPSNKVLLGDSVQGMKSIGYMAVSRNGLPLSSDLLLHDRHQGGAVIAWLDGHANWQKDAQRTLQLQTSASVNCYFDVE